MQPFGLIYVIKNDVFVFLYIILLVGFANNAYLCIGFRKKTS